MNMDYICREVEKLKKKYHEADPFKLCEDMGIILLHTPMELTQEPVKASF